MNTIKLPISKFIDSQFRNYSIYVLEQRGIPNFFDALTPVQRYILMNSPQTFQKTLSVVGKSIEDHYAHGDKSLSSAISKLARPFGSSLQILEGYGFFGSEVCYEPAAPRYTSVKLSSAVYDILKKYKYLTTKTPEGPYDPFWLDIPIGLVTTIIGISVGYKSIILPRKLEDVQKYLEGKIKKIKPYFINFKGNIEKFKDLNNSWLISSDINVNGNRIEVRGLPPVLKYTSVLKKLDWLFNKFESNVRILNNSNTNVIIDIVYLGKKADEWKDIQDFVNKTFSVIVSENVIFVKNEQILVYDAVEEYLDDYKWQLKRLNYNKCTYENNFLSNELEFNKAKKSFIEFILLKKREIKEVDEFLKDFNNELKDRLERMTSKKFTKDELKATVNKIKELTIECKNKQKELKEVKELFEAMQDPTLKRGLSSKRKNIDLFDVNDIKEINGICIWEGDSEDIEEDTEE